MGQHEPVRIVDLWDVRLRMGTMRFGVWVTVAVGSVRIAYAFATWSPQTVRRWSRCSRSLWEARW
jgi:hypothetical protein